MSYDFEKLKAIPIADILAYYQIPVKKRSDKELVAKCPLPSHKEVEHKNANETFCIGLDKNVWFCQSIPCRQIGNHPKGGDVLDLVCRLDHCDVKSAARKLSDLFAVGNNHHPPSKQKPALEGSRAGEVSSGGDAKSIGNHRLNNNTAIAEIRNPPLAFTLRNLDPDHPVLKEKGISIETAMEFGVGYHGGKGSMSGRVCFPLYENGALIGYAGRATNGEEPRWKLPQGIHRTFLFGLERCDPAKPLTITESCWGVLHLFQHGVQSAALVGSSLTDAQETLLAPFAEIRVCMDNDAAGRTAAFAIAERLKASGKKVTKAFIEG